MRGETLSIRLDFLSRASTIPTAPEYCIPFDELQHPGVSIADHANDFYADSFESTRIDSKAITR